MTKIVEKTVVVKNVSGKVKAWDNGVLREVYFKGPTLHGSPAKYFINPGKASRDGFQVVKGRVYQDDQGRPYFLS